ncbi:MAG: lyase [Naasia sp.]|nr:lyase [Naasia sp.]
MRVRAVHHIAVIGSDYERSKAFYTQVLGFTVRSEVYRAERDSWMGDLYLNGRYTLELFSFPAAAPRRSGPEQVGLRHLAFEVDDVDEAAGELAALGVPVEEVRTDPHTGKRFVFFFDPDGQPLELYSA